MLDNEPAGGERTGVESAAETAQNPPTRRARTTRRRAAAPVDAGVPVEASIPDGSPLGEGTPAAPVESLAPVEPVPPAGDSDTTAAKPRRRRKAVGADRSIAQPVSGPEAATGAQSPAGAESPAGAQSPAGAESAPVAAEQDQPTAPPAPKATRTRRKKAAAPSSPPIGPEVDLGAASTGPESEPGAAAPVVPAPQPVIEPTGEETGSPRAETIQPVEEPAPSRRRRAALSAPTVLFMAPEPEEMPAPRVRHRPPVEPVAVQPEPVAVQPEADEEVVAATAPDVDAADLAEEDDDEGGARRRRRRGRRGRGRGKGMADDFDEETEEPTEVAVEVEAEPDEDGEDGGEGMTRRRRRRRRKGAGEIEVEVEDGVPTVVRIREPRRTVDEVQGVSGSTRLEAKRQRRRDGREQRRTRPPILSESEFLARREAVDRVMVVRQRGDRTQIAVLEDGVLVEHYVTRATSATMVGNVYLGKVQNVLPSMEAAFVDIGRGRNAVLYAGEVNWEGTGLEGRARSIEQALRSGDSVLVQVTKDPIGHKGARLTSHLALSGRHLVYVPHGNASGISRKLPDTERKRLRDILKKLVPDGAGVIVRTAAEGASEDELTRDIKRLQAQWEDIQAKATEGGAPVLLYEEPDLVIRVVRDLFNEDFRELVVQGDDAYDMVESYLAHVSPDLVPRLRRHVGATDVFAEKRIDEQILKGLDRKVFLPSGGSLVIDRTEAMTVIDVNTGKYTGTGGNLEETVTRNNLEAAEEIVRQLRLRDLGGIVVIDFIDMVLESNRELVLRRLTECLGRDRTKHQVTEITSLGLVQMTRKRIGAGLLDAFSETCECCKGRGVIIHTEPAPEKHRGGGAGDKVKAVASAPAAPASASATAPIGAPAASVAEKAPADAVASSGTRRRSRKSARSEPETARVRVEDEDETMGYDLSRYEQVEAPAVVGSEDRATGSIRLAGPGDPDAAYGDLGPGGEEGDDAVESGSGAGGRRRVRRSGVRRRTRA